MDEGGEDIMTHREYADEVMGVKGNHLGQKIFAVIQGITFAVVMMSTALVGNV